MRINVTARLFRIVVHLLAAAGIGMSSYALATVPGNAPLPAGEPGLEDDAELRQSHSESVGKDIQPYAERFWNLDKKWRASAGREPSDITMVEVVTELRSIASSIDGGPGGRPALWAEIHESLGDYFLQHVGDWNAALRHYERALSWWGGSRDLEKSRERYLAMIWRMGDFALNDRSRPLPPFLLLENARKLAREPADQARAHFLVALSHTASPARLQEPERVRAEFEAALAVDPNGDLSQRVLLRFAEWAASAGRAFFDERGELRIEPDYALAMELYERLAKSAKETSEFRAIADRAIDHIRSPVLKIVIPFAFHPGSEPRVQLRWRNISQITVAAYALDLSLLSKIESDSGTIESWIDELIVDPLLPPAFTRTIDREPSHPFYYDEEALRITEELLPGAYLIIASDSQGVLESRDILMVSESILVLKCTRNGMYGFLADAVLGSPIADAPVSAWFFVNGNAGKQEWIHRVGTTDASGICRLEAPPGAESGYSVIVSAGHAAAQSLAVSDWVPIQMPENGLRVFAHSNRHVYRPGDTVRWRALVRSIIENGSDDLIVPDVPIVWRLLDSIGGVIDSGEAEPNHFGSISANVRLPADAAAGSYRLELQEQGRPEVGTVDPICVVAQVIASDAHLELTLDGPRVLFPGDIIAGMIHAEYSERGPVSHTPVRLLISREPLNQPMRGDRRNTGGFEIVHEEVLETDLRGSAAFRFETSLDDTMDYDYRIEAHIEGVSNTSQTTSVRVTRQGHHASAELDRRLYRPGDVITATIRTLDAFDDPVASEGVLRITREQWREFWVDRRGRSVTGREMRELRRRPGGFFSFGPRPSDYVLTDEGYDVEEVAIVALTTDSEGTTQYQSTLSEEGYYRFAWMSRDQKNAPIRAEVGVWVTDLGDVDIGYRPEGIQVITDRETVSEGEVLPFMVSLPTADRHVLLSIGTNELQALRVEHVVHSAKVAELHLGPEHAPNTYIEALMAADDTLVHHRAAVRVLPKPRFLDVRFQADASGFEPGGRARFEIEVLDHLGSPVSNTELSFSLSSAEFPSAATPKHPAVVFHCAPKSLGVRTSASNEWKPYFRVIDDTSVPAGGERTSLNDEADRMHSDQLRSGRSFEGVAIPQVNPSNWALESAWTPSVITDDNGQATIDVTMPTTLGSWTATVIAADTAGRFGRASTSVATRQSFLAHIDGPTSLVIGDRADIILNLMNNTDASVDFEIDLTSPTAVALEQGSRTVTVEPFHEARLVWQVEAAAVGLAELELELRSDAYSDRLVFPIAIRQRGFEDWVGVSGHVRSAYLAIPWNETNDVPQKERIVSITPSLASVLLEATQTVLRHDPVGIERMISRFVPIVVLRERMNGAGFARDRVDARLTGLVQDATEQTVENLDSWISNVIQHVIDAQLESGAWAWADADRPDAFMTAYALWGIALGKRAGVPVSADAAVAARLWLNHALFAQPDDFSLQAWILHALAEDAAGELQHRPTRLEARAFLQLMRERERLDSFALALLARSAFNFGFEEDARVVMEILMKRARAAGSSDHIVMVTDEIGTDPIRARVPTTHWQGDQSRSAAAQDSITTAIALQAILEMAPDNGLVDPVANWLLARRSGPGWDSSLNSAIVITALSHYLYVTGDVDANLDFEVLVNGQQVAQEQITPDNAIDRSSVYNVPPDWWRAGSNYVEIVSRSGPGPIYYAVRAREATDLPIASGVSLTDFVVERTFFRVVERPTLLDGFVEEVVPMHVDDRVQSGDRIESVLRIRVPQGGLNRVILEVSRPAGLQRMSPRLGDPWLLRPSVSQSNNGNDSPIRLKTEEYREKVIAFIDHLPEGTWELRHRLRAESPGVFEAPPVIVWSDFGIGAVSASAPITIFIEDDVSSE